MKSKQQQTLSEETQKTLARIEELTMKSEKELLARIIVEQENSNGILERNRKNTSTLTTMAWVILIISILFALIPDNTTLIEIIK